MGGYPLNTTTAKWSIELSVDCPKCERFVDLLEAPDFWENQIKPGEHGTDKTKGLEVTCPECGHEWKVDLVY